MRETSIVIDDGCWKQVWAEMTDSEEWPTLAGSHATDFQIPLYNVGSIQ
jgi:hypothetical protein